MNLAGIRQLFDYTEWANQLTLGAVEKLTKDQQQFDFKISHGSILGTLAHMAGSEWVWLERWRGVSHSSLWAASDFDDLATLSARWRQVEADRRALLGELTEELLQQPLSYKNMKGEPHTLPLAGQMQHVINHATLHRGQVIGLIRQLGAQPPAVDLLYYLLGSK